MKKQKLLSFIKKYYLNGTCDRVILHTDGKGNLATKFVSDPDKSVVGILKESGFDSLTEEQSFGIYSTGILRSLISVLDDEVEIKPNIFGEKTVALDFSDSATTVHFALSELNMIPKAPKSVTEPEYEIVLIVNPANVVSAQASVKDIVFGIDNFKEVLTANDGDFESATMKISSSGFAAVNFKGKDYTAVYYLVGLGGDE